MARNVGDLSLPSAPELTTIPPPPAGLSGVSKPGKLQPAGRTPPSFNGLSDPGTPQPVGRSPASRDALIRAIGRAPGGSRLLQAMQVRQATGDGVPTLRSLHLETMTRAYSLAEAYASGVTLTPMGCEYSGGMYPGAEPMRYSSGYGCVSNENMRAHECWFWVGPLDDPRFSSFNIALATPGNDQQRLAYILELSLTAVPPESLASMRFDVNDEEIDFVGTGSGSLLAAASLPGSSGEREHHLWFKCRDIFAIDRLRFDWLHVTAC